MPRPAIAPVIARVPAHIAKPFIERWHYSRRCPTGKNQFYGWYVESRPADESNLFGETLYAIADYGIGVNPYQAAALSRMAGDDIQDESLVELKRLCRVEPPNDQYPLTRFLSKCHKLLRRDGYKFVVAFSDPAFGHNGGIYRAANFQHLGVTQSERHVVDMNGDTRHRRLYYRFAKRHGVSAKEARQQLGLRVVSTPPKDRWLIKIRR